MHIPIPDVLITAALWVYSWVTIPQTAAGWITLAVMAVIAIWWRTPFRRGLRALVVHWGSYMLLVAVFIAIHNVAQSPSFQGGLLRLFKPLTMAGRGGGSRPPLPPEEDDDHM